MNDENFNILIYRPQREERSAAMRIINAILPKPEISPLYKTECKVCGEWVMERDKQNHKHED
jgi:hypothetical protein